MYVFLGSSIGNFTRREAEVFIGEVATCMKPGDTLLLGVDRVKDEQVLHAAYNDAEGITGQFNLNLLEMYLVSQKQQTVTLNALDEQLHLSEQETILTEFSHKYTRQGAEDLLTGSGLHILDHIQPSNGYFSLILAGI